jgi:hypothetical protein
VAKPLVGGFLAKDARPHQGLLLLFYRAALPLSRQSLNYTAGLIRRHRAKIRSNGRVLNPAQQALLVLVYLRNGDTFTELAAAFAVSTATAWRYGNETVDLLAARSPRLDQALRTAKTSGHAFVVLDGTLIPIDRPFYPGKHKRHGMNLQVIATPAGDIVWVSGALPGSAHDTRAARIWGMIRALERAGWIVPADKGSPTPAHTRGDPASGSGHEYQRPGPGTA